MSKRHGMHVRPADHTMGLITLIRNVLRAPPTTSDAQFVPREPKRIDVYGPKGIRRFVRTIIGCTHSRSHPEDFFVVHELLMRKDWSAGHANGDAEPMHEDLPEVEGEASMEDGGEDESGAEDNNEHEDMEDDAEDEGEALWEEPSAPAAEGLHPNELPGTDFKANKRHFWRKILTMGAGGGEVIVDAGPIIHRDPCIGYVFTALPSDDPHPDAPLYNPRKLVVLGDTSDPRHLIPLCSRPSPSLLVHEATDAFIPTSVDPQSKRSRELVMEKCVERGHSTPEMAGSFAREIGAKRVVLNHLGSRFPAPLANNGPRLRGAVLKEMERQASESWGGGFVRAALDFTRITIPPDRVLDEAEEGEGGEGGGSNGSGGGGERRPRARGRGTGRGRGRGERGWEGRKREGAVSSDRSLSQGAYGSGRHVHKKAKEGDDG
ncbi:hypothetical protein OE88DRAFT_1730629 [Heliocybe sulcata]|uniref:Metallo-beta-lactamase domain-containing protein n=1 Tax=Heliocybe sulcata TaxID=5364 RepID=A0A5C3NK35_9AGAM|nr:hypothetical protein OE88DRAFT_1730629 [Heliocybe sulcata]